MGTVSFGSTYRINGNSLKDYQKQSGMTDFCDKNGLEYATKFETKEIKRDRFSFGKPETKISSTIIAPDNKDSLVEAYLANKGINFKKFDTKELLNKKNIENRLEDAPKGMQLVKVDAEKLEKLISNQDTNIRYCEENYNDYYQDGVDMMFKTGDKFPATTLQINPMGGSTEDAVEYIKRFGADNLNEDQMSFMFNQRTDDPDHCVFFGMKNLGMDKVPVYVDKDTHAIGKALGLFK